MKPLPIIIRSEAGKMLQTGESGTVLGFNNPGLAPQLLAMGILPGSHIELVRAAPFGGALYIMVDQHQVALRRQEFQAIVIRQ